MHNQYRVFLRYHKYKYLRSLYTYFQQPHLYEAFHLLCSHCQHHEAPPVVLKKVTVTHKIVRRNSFKLYQCNKP